MKCEKLEKNCWLYSNDWKNEPKITETSPMPVFIYCKKHHDDDYEIAYFTVRWKTRASFVYRTMPYRAF